MATLSLDLTITAGEANRIQAAYQVAANASINATASQTQVLAYIKSVLRQKIVDDVKVYEKSVLVAAITDPTSINPT